MSRIENFTSEVFLEHGEGYRAEARVRSLPPVSLDEPEVLGGEDTAPSPLEYLLTAVGGCLVSSLSLCLKKKRLGAHLTARAVGRVARDAEDQLRVEKIEVELRVAAPEDQWPKVEGCFRIFEKYCIVTASVSRGIPVETRLALSAPAA